MSAGVLFTTSREFYAKNSISGAPHLTTRYWQELIEILETRLTKLSNGTDWSGGRLLNIHIGPTASVAMEEVSAANFVAGRGIEGDRYFLGTGTYSAKPDFREVTVFELEVLEALARNDPPLQSGPIKLRPADHRRNLTVCGVPLNHLVGRRFRVGKAVLFGGRLNSPCKYLEKLLDLPVYLPLYNRSGLNCRIEKGGIVHRGDPVEPLDDR